MLCLKKNAYTINLQFVQEAIMETNPQHVNLEPEHADLFKRFLKEIQLWCRTGKEPKTGSQDINYCLALQENDCFSTT